MQQEGVWKKRDFSHGDIDAAELDEPRQSRSKSSPSHANARNDRENSTLGTATYGTEVQSKPSRERSAGSQKRVSHSSNSSRGQPRALSSRGNPNSPTRESEPSLYTRSHSFRSTGTHGDITVSTLQEEDESSINSQRRLRHDQLPSRSSGAESFSSKSAARPAAEHRAERRTLAPRRSTASTSAGHSSSSRRQQHHQQQHSRHSGHSGSHRTSSKHSGGGHSSSRHTASAAAQSSRSRSVGRARSPAAVRRLANLALQELHAQTGGPQWRCSDWWLVPGSDVRKWHGVSVHEGNLVGLDLMCNELRGEIPSAVGDFFALKVLNLSYNHHLSGRIPRSIGNLTRLRVLHLYSASLEGSIPDTLGALRSLQELWLNDNRLTGRIPPSLGNLVNLRELYLNSNNIEGSIPLSFSNLTNLEGLNLSYNRMRGEFPDQLVSMVSLKLLCLEGNPGFTGLPPADSGKSLQEWLNAKRVAHMSRLEKRLRDAEYDKDDELARLAAELEASNRRVRALEKHVKSIATTPNALRSPGQEQQQHEADAESNAENHNGENRDGENRNANEGNGLSSSGHTLDGSSAAAGSTAGDSTRSGKTAGSAPAKLRRTDATAAMSSPDAAHTAQTGSKQTSQGHRRASSGSPAAVATPPSGRVQPLARLKAVAKGMFSSRSSSSSALLPAAAAATAAAATAAVDSNAGADDGDGKRQLDDQHQDTAAAAAASSGPTQTSTSEVSAAAALPAAAAAGSVAALAARLNKRIAGESLSHNDNGAQPTPPPNSPPAPEPEDVFYDANAAAAAAAAAPPQQSQVQLLHSDSLKSSARKDVPNRGHRRSSSQGDAPVANGHHLAAAEEKDDNDDDHVDSNVFFGVATSLPLRHRTISAVAAAANGYAEEDPAEAGATSATAASSAFATPPIIGELRRHSSVSCGVASPPVGVRGQVRRASAGNATTGTPTSAGGGGSLFSRVDSPGVLRRGASSVERTFLRLQNRLSPQRASAAERKARRSSLGDTQQVALVTGYLTNGEPPDVMAVLADKAAAPFSLTNFTEWATDNLLEENLDFYFEVQTYKLCTDSELLTQCRTLVDSFVRPGAETEVNLSSTTRLETMVQVDELAALIQRTRVSNQTRFNSKSDTPPDQSQHSDADETADTTADVADDVETDKTVKGLFQSLRRVFAPAEAQILHLIKMDAYPRFVAAINAVLEAFAAGRVLTLEDLEIVRAAVAYRKEQRKEAQRLAKIAKAQVKGARRAAAVNGLSNGSSSSSATSTEHNGLDLSNDVTDDVSNGVSSDLANAAAAGIGKESASNEDTAGIAVVERSASMSLVSTFRASFERLSAGSGSERSTPLARARSFRGESAAAAAAAAAVAAAAGGSSSTAGNS